MTKCRAKHVFLIKYCSFLTVFENGEYSYKIVLSSDDSRTWFEAEEICREYEGGHLASISNEDENKYLNEKIQLVSSSPREPEELWIGAKDEEYGGVYQWTDGKTFQWVTVD